MEEEGSYADPVFSEAAVKIRDLEEKQRILKDRTILIGQNLLETKEKTSSEVLELKKGIMELNESVQRINSFLETASREFSKFAKKEDLEILSRQAKMFQPLEFVRKSELKKENLT